MRPQSPARTRFRSPPARRRGGQHKPSGAPAALAQVPAVPILRRSASIRGRGKTGLMSHCLRLWAVLWMLTYETRVGGPRKDRQFRWRFALVRQQIHVPVRDSVPRTTASLILPSVRRPRLAEPSISRFPASPSETRIQPSVLLLRIADRNSQHIVCSMLSRTLGPHINSVILISVLLPQCPPMPLIASTEH
jgi:hypothetical protein